MSANLPPATPVTTTARADSTVAAMNAINRDIIERRTSDRAHVENLSYVDFRNTPVNPDLLAMTNFDEAMVAVALPFFRVGKKLRVAVAEPEAMPTIAYLTALRKKLFEVHLALASRDGILEKIAELKKLQPASRTLDNCNAETDLQTYETEIHALTELSTTARGMAASAVLNQLLVGALRTTASDIHIQAESDAYLIRFRIDGLLQEVVRFDKKIGTELLSQLKYDAKLRLNVTTIPQDGRLSFTASGRTIDLRIATLPTHFGESAVCRVLDREKKIQSFESLGYTDTNLHRILRATEKTEGLILVTGPTGSGKTTTLYAMLDRVNRPDRKVATLEDPIEYHLARVAQSQIDEENGYTFAAGLRALLRADPDVMMVGEIRDRETAETAASAAMTGHLVLSTLHTNSAVEAMSRLTNLGVPAYLIAGSLSLVVAQRLVRRIHTDCARKVVPTDRERAILTAHLDRLRALDPNADLEMPAFVWQPVGCPACAGTGYRGQLALTESFIVDDTVRALILKSAPDYVIREHLVATQHFMTLAEDGIAKVCRGETTLAEVARVTDIETIPVAPTHTPTTLLHDV